MVSFSPVHHGTEHKIRVHAFYCVLALQIAHLMRRHAQLDILGVLRDLATDDPAMRLHLLASLIRQAETGLTSATLDAHDHGYTTTEITVLLDLG